SQPNLLQEIAKFMVPMLPHDTEVLGALEMGGIPLATAISIETGIPMCFVRKEAKTYGTCKLAEGADFTGKKVCLIEDVITTGGAVVDATIALREQGAEVDHVLCVIYRGEGKATKLDELKLTYTPLFTATELK
ncbi:MAG: orotate phosphoribosyltransferase, partial [Bdellovibrionales bacterium]|nr:orotate phosphoribosyltransferase [Bdellovibrionales bacterium]